MGMQRHGQTDTLTGKSNENIEGKGKERQNSETYNGDLINEYAKKQIKKQSNQVKKGVKMKL